MKLERELKEREIQISELSKMKSEEIKKNEELKKELESEKMKLNLREKQLLESNRANSSLTEKTHTLLQQITRMLNNERERKGLLQHGRSPQKKRQRKTKDERRV